MAGDCSGAAHYIQGLGKRTDNSGITIPNMPSHTHNIAEHVTSNDGKHIHDFYGTSDDDLGCTNPSQGLPLLATYDAACTPPSADAIFECTNTHLFDSGTGSKHHHNIPAHSTDGMGEGTAYAPPYLSINFIIYAGV